VERCGAVISSGIISLTQTRPTPLVLSNLPVELHDLVFEELGIRDVFHLAFTNKYFWKVGQRHIQNFFVLGPWAGQSVICLGDSLPPDAGLPEVLTEPEEEAVRRVLCEYSKGHGRIELTNLRDFPGRRDCCDDLGEYLRRELAYHMSGPEPYRNYMSMRWAVMNCVSTPDLSRFYSQSEPWILRNLTTKEYVRSEAIALKPEYIRGPYIDALGFGEVIISRICWSTDSSVSTPYEGGLHRGIWAGHRFDIRTLASHEKLTKAEEKKWNDISEEVIKEIEIIWECEFGSDWRRLLIEREDKMRYQRGEYEMLYWM
jgi:hypothetical protein